VKTWQLLIAAGIVWALQAAYFVHARSWLGFPDGSLTELARVRRPLYLLLGASCAAAAIVSWALAYKASRAGTSRAAKAVLLALPITSALIWILDRGLAASLDDGRGG
jgi:hypothetical protein